MEGTEHDKRLKTFPDLKTYVDSVKGKKALQRVLISNNGIAAVKFIRSVRSWAYATFNNEKEIEFVAMATPEDLLANAEYIRLADQVCHVPGGSNINNYANVNLIVEIAQQYSVDAVWAGWGHASENPRLPNTLDKLGIVFIGPPGGPMYALGDKIGSTIIAQSAKVPTIAWNGDGLTVEYAKSGEIPEETYQAANVTTVEEARRQIEKLGVPVMIKASEGGGGKGIRMVDDMSNIEAAFRQVQSELPGSPIFIMRLSTGARHLEVQLLADAYGQAIALSGRDCSVQRRHQKILEEGPPAAADPKVWVEMEKAAVRLAKEVGYVNAGTVEYLYDDKDNFYFLELNPRLQVEHPVTEMITGVNLPACQLQVSMGIPLNCIPDVRNFYQCEDLYSNEPIDFDGEYTSPPTVTCKTLGHTIAARITAENPFEGFQPTSGAITEINFRSLRNVWGYFSVDSSGRVHEFADSQIGHVFAWGETREEARRNLAMALNDLSIRGEIRTTIEYLKDLIEVPDYRNNKFDTAWLDKRIKANVDIAKIDPLVVILVGAVCTGHQHITGTTGEYQQMLERGQLPPAALIKQSKAFELIYEDVKYKLAVARTGAITYRVTCNGSGVDAELRCLADGGFLVLMGGKSHVAYNRSDVGAQRYIIDGQTCLFADEYDPTQLRAQMGGKLLRYLKDDGAALSKGEPFAEIEVMKMNMPLCALEEGTLTQVKPEGAVMEPGDVICTMELADPSKVRRARVFEDPLPVLGEPWPQTLDNMPHQTVERATRRLENVMSGYDVSDAALDAALASLDEATGSPLLPVLEIEGYLSRNKNDLPTKLVQDFEQRCSEQRFKKDADANAAKAFVADLYAQAKEQQSSPENTNRPALKTMLELLGRYTDGLHTLQANAYAALVRQYVDIEQKFAELEASDAAEKDDVLQELRVQHSTDIPLVVAMSMAYNSRHSRDALTIKLLSKLETLVRLADKEGDRALRERCTQVLECVAGLQGHLCTEVALEARQGLIEIEHSYRETTGKIVEQLKAYMSGDEAALKALKESTSPILSYIMDIIVQQDNYDLSVRKAAMSIYVERVYASYEMVKVETSEKEAGGHPQLNTAFEFFSNASDSVQMAGPGDDGGRGVLSSASSVEDLSSLLAPSNSLSLIDVAGASEALSDEMTETSSVGLEIDTFDVSGIEKKKSFLRSLQKPKKNLDKARAQSVDDERTSNEVAPFVHRMGLMAQFAGFAEMEKHFCDRIAGAFSASANQVQVAPINVAHVVMACEFSDEEELSARLGKFLQSAAPCMKENHVRRVTFAVVRLSPSNADVEEKTSIVAGHGGHFFTFRASKDFAEDRIVRNIETPLAFQLDLERLANFQIKPVSLAKAGGTARSQTVHVYEAVPKGASVTGASERRYFVRALVRQTEKIKGNTSVVGEYDAYPGPERVFVQALRALETLQADKKNASSTRKNHIFLNLLSDASDVDSEYVQGIIRTLHRRYAKRLIAQKVSEFEVRLFAVLADGAPSIPVRVIASNPTGFALNIETYVEASDPANQDGSIFYSLNDNDGGLGGALAAMGLSASDHDLAMPVASNEVGQLHGKPLNTPYDLSGPFDERRARANAAGTTFCYDFPDLFSKALELSWRTLAEKVAPKPLSIPARRLLCEVEELILDDEMDEKATPLSHGLSITSRAPGRNKIGMVAWKVTLRTPEYPDGRPLVLIANDISFKAGSFGTREDHLFDCASKYARSLGIPRIYLAANSGARIGMAEEVKRVYKIKWSNESDPTKGFEYFYIEEDDYASLGPGGRKSVVATKVADKGHYRIDAIIGETPDLGVENLRGSGTIAGETSRAYEESFTLSYVTGRSVGIGSYLNRLGQRVIQKGSNAPILLTGYQALNSLMGRDVYTSNLQLGGTKIMYGNGVSHHSVRHDLEGVTKIISWISYVPATAKAPIPVSMLTHGERIDRPVQVHPKDLGDQYDPRLLLRGYTNDKGAWVPGFFDKDSFEESLGGWAKTVITGRARLGGLPMGVITSEVRTVEARAPADPAAPDTTERVWQQAGQVWFPDSSFKTAQAIRDVGREGLPLIIFSSWRGFSGGTRDMMDQVLKFGAQIVDALVEFKQPVFVHIPPGGELRGGAWVVVDPTINADVMEMSADTDARGGVLEAPGAASIKYRKKDMIATMHRVDDELKRLDEQLKSAGDKDKKAVQEKIAAREKTLGPIYQQIAIQFADDHDKPQRMLAKGVIRKIVPWEQSRVYFYNRLCRRLAEQNARSQLRDALALFPDNQDSPENASEALDQTLAGLEIDLNDDKVVTDFLNSADGKRVIEAHCSALKADAIAKQVVAMGEQDNKAIVRGLMMLIKSLQEKGRVEERDAMVNILKQGLFFLN